MRVSVSVQFTALGEDIHTEVSNSTNLTGYLLFGVLPNARKEVDD